MRITSVAVFGLVLAGCSVGPNYEKPQVEVPDRWLINIAEAEQVANTQWWRQFGDPVLDALVNQALLSNRDVRIAAARVEQFAAQLNVTRADYYPQIGYGASADRSGIQDEAVVPGGDSITDTYQATLNVGWELDIWGRVRRASEAGRADLLAAEEVRRTVLLSLVSSVATSYVGLRRLDRQLEIAVETRDTRGEALKLFELKFNGGVISDLELAQVRSEYEQAAAVVPGIEREIGQLENLLSVLLGRPPGAIPRGQSIDHIRLAAVPAGIPSQLLERRPDLRAAEQQMIAANARIGVAKAAYFPTISLTGLAGFVSGDLSSWFDQDYRVWGAGGDLFGSIFAGGRIKGSVEQATALRKEALFNYQQSILEAFREVEDALIQIQKATEQLEIEQRQVDALLNYARLAQLRYNNGYTSYIEVLDAQRSLFNAQLNYVNTQNTIFVGLINSYKAMGGGWVDIAQREADRVDFPDAADQPEPTEVTADQE